MGSIITIVFVVVNHLRDFCEQKNTRRSGLGRFRHGGVTNSLA